MSRVAEPDRGPAALRGIVSLILPDYPALDASIRNAIEDDVCRYVAGQIRAMPGFLRLPYRVALFGFDWLPLLRYGRPFRALSPARRSSYLAWWSDGPIASMRDFVRLIRSVALLVYFDHALVFQRLNEQRQRVHTPADDSEHHDNTKARKHERKDNCGIDETSGLQRRDAETPSTKEKSD